MTHPKPLPSFPYPLLSFWIARILPGWAGAALMIFFFQIAVCGIVHDNQNVSALLAFLDVLPPFIKTMLGGGALSLGNVDALIAIGYQHPLILIVFMVFAVATPTALLAGEVQRGAMELILSRPVTKTQVYLCAALPTLLGMFGLTILLFLGTVAGTALFDFGKPVALGAFFRLSVNGGLLATAVGSIALLAASFFRERGRAVGITVAFLVVSYFINLISVLWPMMRRLRPFTLFDYVDGVKIFERGVWPFDDMLVLGAVIVVASILGALVWRRRDLPL